MSKKKPRAAELEELERIAELSADERVQHVRRLERDNAKERAARHQSERKYRQSEVELAATEADLARLLYLKENAMQRQYGAKHRCKAGQATAIVCVNDWHTEQTIDPDTVGGVNEFNLQIADKRIARTWERAAYMIDFARKISNIDEVVVWAGGDLINGMIHEELQQANALGPGDATLHVQDHLVSGIRFLMKETKCAHLRFLANYGNHGRTTQRRRIHTAASHSWEYVIYVNAAQILSQDPSFRGKFSYHVERGEMLKTQIQGYNCRFNHGHNLRYYGGVGGIMVPVNKAIAAWNRSHGFAELDVIGHFHQFHSTPNFVACGCLCGFDPYAESIRASWELPSQTLIVMDREYGKVMAERIFCEERVDAHSQWHTAVTDG